MVSRPHFLLFCDGQSPKISQAKEAAFVGAASNAVRGRWRFVLEDLEAGTRLEACDAELVQAPERAALLAVVRGLEALEQPSRVTLVTTSRYVSRGLQFGLSEWRESDYCWEHFGSVQPIRNADLWRRIDHALQFHQINCQWIAGQANEDGEDVTELQIEPILANQPIPVLNSVVDTSHGDQGLSAATLAEHDGTDPAVDIKNSFFSNKSGSIIWRFMRGPIRSLRLPNLFSSRKSVARQGVIGRLIVWLSCLFKRARMRRLAI